MIATATTPAMPMNRTFLRRSCAFCCRRISSTRALRSLTCVLFDFVATGALLVPSLSTSVSACAASVQPCRTDLVSELGTERSRTWSRVVRSPWRRRSGRCGEAEPTPPTAVVATARCGGPRTPEGAGTIRIVAQPANATIHATAWGPGADWLLETFPPHSVPTTTRADSFPHTRSFAISPGSIGVGGCRAAAGSWRHWCPRFSSRRSPACKPASRGRRCCGGTPSPRRGRRRRACVIFPTADTWAAIPSWDWHRAGVDGKRSRTILAAVALPIDSRRASISTMRRTNDACVPFPASARGRRLR